MLAATGWMKPAIAIVVGAVVMTLIMLNLVRKIPDAGRRAAQRRIVLRMQSFWAIPLVYVVVFAYTSSWLVITAMGLLAVAVVLAMVVWAAGDFTEFDPAVLIRRDTWSIRRRDPNRPA